MMITSLPAVPPWSGVTALTTGEVRLRHAVNRVLVLFGVDEVQPECSAFTTCATTAATATVAASPGIAAAKARGAGPASVASIPSFSSAPPFTAEQAHLEELFEVGFEGECSGTNHEIARALPLSA
jgi:hypothetical protein